MELKMKHTLVLGLLFLTISCTVYEVRLDRPSEEEIVDVKNKWDSQKAQLRDIEDINI